LGDGNTSGERRSSAPLERSERDRLQRHGAHACCGLPTLDAAVSISAADVRDARIGINVAVLERDPLSRPQAGRGSEQHEWPVARSDLSGKLFEFRPRLEWPFFGVPALRIIDALLRGIRIDQSPADGSREHLA
jgi:hypothetical protein